MFLSRNQSLFCFFIFFTLKHSKVSKELDDSRNKIFEKRKKIPYNYFQLWENKLISLIVQENS